jgi:hypothetical protein
MRSAYMPYLDDSRLVLLMFTNWNRVLANTAGHANMKSQPGGHALAPLAAKGGRAYLQGLPDPEPAIDFVAVPHSGALSHGLK